MTALAGREVKRTFSYSSQLRTGLPRPDTHQAERQQIGEFGKAVGGIIVLHAIKMIDARLAVQWGLEAERTAAVTKRAQRGAGGARPTFRLDSLKMRT